MDKQDFESLAQFLAQQETQEAKAMAEVGKEEFEELALFFPEGTTAKQMLCYLEHETEKSRLHQF